MGISSHQLQKEFPEFHDRIEALKASDPRFKERLARYSELDQEIEGLEREKRSRRNHEVMIGRMQRQKRNGRRRGVRGRGSMARRKHTRRKHLLFF